MKQPSETWQDDLKKVGIGQKFVQCRYGVIKERLSSREKSRFVLKFYEYEG